MAEHGLIRRHPSLPIPTLISEKRKSADHHAAIAVVRFQLPDDIAFADAAVLPLGLGAAASVSRSDVARAFPIGKVQAAAITSFLRAVARLTVYALLEQFGIDGTVRAALVAAQAADAV